MTQDVSAVDVVVGDRLWLGGSIWPVRALDRVGENTIRLHLARERLGFIEPEAWSPLLCATHRIRRVTA